MLLSRIIITPLIGCVIGYITNDLAIRMLFRPRKAVYIGKFHVPFTPGLIPAQQSRIANSIGGVISSQLLNEETLRQTLLSDGAVNTLREKAKTALQSLSEDQRRISDLLSQPYLKEKFNLSVDDLQKKLTDILCEKIIDARLGYTVVDSIGGKLDFITQNRLLTMLLDESTQESIRENLAEKVNEIIAERAPDASAAIVGRFRTELLEAPLCDLYAKYRDREDTLVGSLTDLYVSILGNNLGKLLGAINIEKIVVDKINGFDPAQLEAMIFGIMKKELRAIVYLGALLGFVMGFINLLL